MFTSKKKAASSEPKPAKTGRMAEIREAYKAIHTLDPRVGWWMAGAALLAFLVVAALVGYFSYWYLGVVVGLTSAALAATLVMNQRGNKAMYSAVEGQPGAAGVTLSALGKNGWYTSSEPVAVDAVRGTKVSDLTGTAIAFRALGRPGIVLIGEGPAGRVDRLLKAEEKKVAKIAPGVPVHRWTVGDDEGQVPLRKLNSKLTRMKPVLTKEEVAAVHKRVTSLGGMRTGIPAGIDPTRVRMDRRALRGK